MNRKKSITVTVLLMICAMTIPLFASTHSGQEAVKPCSMQESSGVCMPNQTKDIVGVASGDTRFQTLVGALKAADLVEPLKAEGPFTVFAPTNEAFSKIPQETLDNLLKPENKEDLADLLKYHVYPGKLTAADVVKLDGQEITMLNGDKAKVEVKGDEVFINGAKIITTDIETQNGVIHAIDTVIMPPSE